MQLEDLPIRSMSAVRDRDREGWLALFEEDAVVEDPVGGNQPWDQTGEGQRGKAAIARFYDMIAGSQESLDFEVHFLVAVGQEAACYVTMTITMNDGTRNESRMINIYRRSPGGKIASLRSFWN